MPDNFGASLEEDFAPAWMGKSGTGVQPGDKIVGKVTDISEAWSDQSNDYYPIFTIHNEETDKREAVHVFWIALLGELEKWDPQISDRVAILYKEDKENKVKGRKPIKVFRVQVEGKTPKVFRSKRRERAGVVSPQPEQAITEDSSNEEEDLPY